MLGFLKYLKLTNRVLKIALIHLMIVSSAVYAQEALSNKNKSDNLCKELYKNRSQEEAIHAAESQLKESPSKVNNIQEIICRGDAESQSGLLSKAVKTY